MLRRCNSLLTLVVQRPWFQSFTACFRLVARNTKNVQPALRDRATSITTLLVEAQNNIYVLVFYGLVFGAGLPYLVVRIPLNSGLVSQRSTGKMVVWLSSNDKRRRQDEDSWAPVHTNETRTPDTDISSSDDSLSKPISSRSRAQMKRQRKSQHQT